MLAKEIWHSDLVKFLFTMVAFILLSACAPAGKVRDWNSLVMKFDQRECYGPCPVYSVEVHGNGDVVYIGKRYVTVLGEHRYKLPAREVEALFEAFEAAQFDSLEDHYDAWGTDLPSEEYAISFDGHVKTITDGRAVPALVPVIHAFETHGHVEQWSKGNYLTVAALRKEGFDFHTQEAGALFTRAAILGDPEVVLGLLRENVPLNVETEFKPSYVCVRRFHQTALLLKAAKAKAGGCYL